MSTKRSSERFQSFESFESRHNNKSDNITPQWIPVWPKKQILQSNYADTKTIKWKDPSILSLNWYFIFQMIWRQEICDWSLVSSYQSIDANPMNRKRMDGLMWGRDTRSKYRFAITTNIDIYFSILLVNALFVIWQPMISLVMDSIEHKYDTKIWSHFWSTNIIIETLVICSSMQYKWSHIQMYTTIHRHIT